MNEIKQIPYCSIHVDTASMEERIFRYTDTKEPDIALAGLWIAKQMIENDPSLLSAEMRQAKDRISLEVVVRANEPNSWMSPSAEFPQIERQALVFKRLGNVSLH